MANEKTLFEVKERNSQKDNPSDLSSFLSQEYQQAKEKGFKGTIDDYISKRDYT